MLRTILIGNRVVAAALVAVLGAFALGACSSVEHRQPSRVIVEGADLDDDWEVEFDD